MGRKLGPCPEVPVVEAGHSDAIIKRYSIDVITPLFGGGVLPGQNDPVTPIRGTSIRGHLRFWWRATRGAQCSGVRELRKREAEIWGATDNPSPVTIEVELDPRRPGRPEPCAAFSFKAGYPAYALFPFQGNKKKPRPIAIALRDARFFLTLRYAEERQTEVEAALWAWLNFGGLGARTRRGCGALYCGDFAPSALGQVAAWFADARAAYGFSVPRPLPWPTLATPPMVQANEASHSAAWNLAVGVMQRFRQGAGIGRSSERGRSLWPEADSIRAMTGKGRPITLECLAANPAFPRSRLGLPIIFHFKDEPGLAEDIELSPHDTSRMASPVVLRPLAVGDGSRALPMILRLMAPGPSALRLKGVERELGIENISRPDLAAYPGSPLRRSKTGSALEAFFLFARDQGFGEAKP